MNRMHRTPFALVVGVIAVLATVVIQADGDEPTNPLRSAAAKRSVARRNVSNDRTAKRMRGAVSQVASTQADDTVAKPLVRQASHQEPAMLPAAMESNRLGGPMMEMAPGEYIVEDGMSGMPGEMLFDDYAGDFAGGGCCDGGGCQQCCLIPCPTLSLDNFEFFGGVHGFTGPKNRGQAGSFGFHTGFNWGAPVPCSGGALGMEFGLNAAFSNFSGASFTEDDRNQLFLTGGLFRRVDWGIQGGLAVDYLSDRWYTDTDLVQVRGEASWVFPCTHELGFWFASGTNDDTQISNFSGTATPLTESWEPLDLYAFFYRHRFAGHEGASGRLYAGFSGDSDGLIGADLQLPLSFDFALEAGFTYLIPEEAGTGALGGGHEHEAWNIGLTLVWYPGCRQAIGNDYYRPLQGVANNGNFIVNRMQ